MVLFAVGIKSRRGPVKASAVKVAVPMTTGKEIAQVMNCLHSRFMSLNTDKARSPNKDIPRIAEPTPCAIGGVIERLA